MTNSAIKRFCPLTFVTLIYEDLTKNWRSQYKEKVKFISFIRLRLISWPVEWRVIKDNPCQEKEHSQLACDARAKGTKVQHKTLNKKDGETGQKESERLGKSSPSPCSLFQSPVRPSPESPVSQKQATPEAWKFRRASVSTSARSTI